MQTNRIAGAAPTRPADGRRPSGEPSAPAAGEAPVVTAYRRRLHEVHRLAELLDALVRDPRFTGSPGLPVELRDSLADAIEILTEVRDRLPT